MNHFEKACKILSEGGGGPPPARPSTLPPPRQKGDPLRLRGLYRRLIEAARSEDLEAIEKALESVSQNEASCAPPGSPWARPWDPDSKDESSFASAREFAAICSRYLRDPRPGTRALLENELRKVRL